MLRLKVTKDSLTGQGMRHIWSLYRKTLAIEKEEEE